MPDSDRIRIGDKYQATELSALTNRAAARQDSWLLEPQHGERFQGRVKRVPLSYTQDRRYNIDDGHAMGISVWRSSFLSNISNSFWKSNGGEEYRNFCYLRFEKGMAVRVKDHGCGVIVSFRDTQNMEPTWKPFLVELYDDKTMYISETDIEFARITNNELGHILILKDGRLHSMEFVPWHVEFGESHYYENGQLVRREFAKFHPSHGQIHYFKGGNHKCTEFAQAHQYNGGEIWYFHVKNGNHERTEFAQGHQHHGEIRYFAEPLPISTLIDDLTHDKNLSDHWQQIHTHYAQFCANNNLMELVKYLQSLLATSKLITMIKNRKCERTEFAKSHENHGEIRYFKNGRHERTEFAQGHQHHGEIRYFKDGKHERTEFVQGHKYHGEIRYFLFNNNNKKRKVRDDMLKDMKAMLAKETVDEAAIKAHIDAVMSKEFPTIDLSNSEELDRMSKRSTELRKSYKSPLSAAYDNVCNAIQEFEATAKKMKVDDATSTGLLDTLCILGVAAVDIHRKN